MYIDFKKSHKGQSALQILKTCEVCRSQAGDWAIFPKDIPFCIIVVTEDYDLIFVHASAEENFGLRCSKRAKARAKALIDKVEQLETEEY